MKDPKQERNELVDRAINLWRIYAEDYRTRVIIYLFLLSWKRELKMTPLNPMRKRDLAEYPKNTFFSLLYESEARGMLDSMTTPEIERLISDIEQMISTNYYYVTVGNKIIEYKYQIAHRGEKFQFGYDPSYKNGSFMPVARRTHGPREEG